MCDNCLVWVELRWLPGAHPAMLTPPPQWDRGENEMKKLMVRDKGGDITSQLLSLAKQTRFGED